MQEAAQLLCGPDMPRSVIQALTNKARLGGLLVINASPYDGCLEKVCLTWHQSEKFAIDHLSVALTSQYIDYVQKTIALKLLEAMKKCRVKSSPLVSMQFLVQIPNQYANQKLKLD